MLGVARRRLDAGHGSDVEAGFVENEDDVRPLARHLAGLAGRHAKPVRRRIGFDPALGRQLVGREHAGTGEVRHVIDALERLGRRLRDGERHHGQDSETGDGEESGGGTPHTERVEPPEQDQHGDRQHGGDDDGRAQIGEDGQ